MTTGIVDKIIFLDLDGVINSDKFARWCHKNMNFIKEGGHNWIDPDAVAKVVSIADSTGAKIVLTSSWRLWEFNQTIRNLSDKRDLKPILDRMIGITERTEERHRGREIKYFLNHCRKNHFNSQLRSDRLIKEGVKIVQEPKYLIIDDDTDFLPEQIPFFIKTDFMVGITQKDVEMGIKILNEDD